MDLVSRCARLSHPGVYQRTVTNCRGRVVLIEAHNKKIKRVVPKDQLLVMRIEDGWEPLCKFLGKPVPNEPFPRENDSAAADKVAAGVIGKLLLMWAGLFAVTGGTAYAGWHLWKQW